MIMTMLIATLIFSIMIMSIRLINSAMEFGTIAPLGQCGSEECDAACKSMYEFFEKSYSAGWAIRHPSIIEAYRARNCSIAIEIGTARAELAKALMTALPIREYHAVDPFLGGYDKSDAMSNELEKANSSSIWAQAIRYKMKDFGCKFRLHHGLSTDMVAHFQPETADCIFVDGDHTHEGVVKDLKAWTPIIKVGGAIFFDDVSRQFPGVGKALNAFSRANNFRPVKINNHNNYYVIKSHNATNEY